MQGCLNGFKETTFGAGTDFDKIVTVFDRRTASESMIRKWNNDNLPHKRTW